MAELSIHSLYKRFGKKKWYAELIFLCKKAKFWDFYVQMEQENDNFLYDRWFLSTLRW